jgi:adenylyltransferase/sulfurtransferase
MNQAIQYDRYQRQLILKGFGMAGQQKLSEARVLVIGAGGLGCPIMQYLVAAGVGHIGIADNDKVSLSNLHRQVISWFTVMNMSSASKAKSTD